MVPVLTAVTEQVHLAQTPLVNWTLVADDSGVLLIDAAIRAAARMCWPRWTGSASDRPICGRFC